MFQRKRTRQGKGLGKTTGWVHRAAVKMKRVKQISGASYERIDDDGLHLAFRDVEGRIMRRQVLDVDSVVLCTGQESVRDLVEPLKEAGIPSTVIGGADFASELDAKRAIRQGTEVVAGL